MAKKNKAEKDMVAISFRVTAEELAAIDAAASSDDRNRSNWMRRQVLKGVHNGQA